MIRRLMALAAVVVAVGAVVVLLPNCGKQYALLLTIKAQPSSSPPGVYDLRVKDVANGDVVLERVGEKVDPNDPNRDISKEGEALRVAIEFADSGNYLVYIWARSGSSNEGSQYFLRDFAVDDVVEKTITLVPLVGDADGDGFPACKFPGVTCGPINCNYLDCNDKPNEGENINPFAAEVCENGIDDDCSDGCDPKPPLFGDAKCVDEDNDGMPAGAQDCDDADPCRSTGMKEAKNLCNTTGQDWDNQFTAACKKKLADDGKQYTPPFCGDGIDQDCNGTDVACFVDEDCDGFEGPKDGKEGPDCNDKDPKINPQAPEVCDGIDNNCNKVIDEGCLPCDVDGDEHAWEKYTGSACNFPKDDPDDFDSGIHPKTTEADGGKEGGTVLGALRGYCYATPEKNKKLKHREVDHDGDKLPASQDGCPAENCDVDGDGFQGAQCSPPKLEEDCNDGDPKVFPGAPDLCGDGVAQNCNQDQDCSTDSDGDKYPDADDCDPKDATVHPWALEVCDGRDNDCDELRDEGNPDPQGNPMATDSDRAPEFTCNNDPHGKCQDPVGKCACSKLPTDDAKYNANYPVDPTRKMCPGENHAVKASPRCFGAITPKKEQCDSEDWNCDDQPFVQADVTNNDFVDKDKSCGTNKGTCKAGKVIGCNLQQTLASQVIDVMNKQQLEFNQHWVCSSDTVYPVIERCNGKDDDCDGLQTVQDVVGGADPGWKELNEKDVDSDAFMKCGGCQTNDLAAGLKGCGDCNDQVPSIYPGAPELCDNIDNNCVPGDDGATECTGGTSCCSSQKACRNLSNDTQNCGACGTECTITGPTRDTDRCTNGNCVCGTTSGPCTGNRNCESASCQCIPNGLCNGCCRNNNCVTGNTTSDCGNNGETCDTCTTSDPCKNPVCNSSRNCATSNKSNTTPCPGGLCYGGSCCTNCWDGSNCVSPSNTVADCGNAGENCDTCTTGNECKTPVCNTAFNCTTVNNADDSNCTNGKCWNGDCCTGCWGNDSTCHTTPNLAYCGDDGAQCTVCNDGGNDCLAPNCSTGACLTPPKSNGASCQSGAGECFGGDCCTVCWHGGSCQSSSNDDHCGTGGGACDVCTATNQPDCVSGGCTCQIGGDCGGCCSGGICRPGNTAQYCGTGGAACIVNCDDSDPCTVNDCDGSNCDYSTATCGSNRCCGGNCCGSDTCCNSAGNDCCAGDCCGTACCSSGATCCGNNCCGSDTCCDGGSCCAGACCGSSCCGAGTTQCCGNNCCGTDSCCDGNSCCAGTCCGTTCCAAGEVCCGNTCCAAGTTQCCGGACCGTDTCCDASGTACCSGTCSGATCNP